MLELKNIAVKAGNFSLGPIDMHISEGEYRVLLGSTGAGKSMLLNLVAGLMQPETGTIILDGNDITHVPSEKRNLGVVFQDLALFPHLSVAENIAFGLKMRGVHRDEIKKAVEETAGFLSITHILERFPRNLSGGERQRTALARALVLHPHMLLLDEPLSSVDRLTRDRLVLELKRIHSELGLTILHITHDIGESFRLAQRISVMRRGKVLQEGTPNDLITRPESRFVAELLGIRNFIPARIEHDRFYDEVVVMRGLGWLPLSSFPHNGIARPADRFLVTVPDWAVELDQPKGKEPSIWEGDVRISDIEHMDGHVCLTLLLPGANRLQVSLSHREIASNANLLIEGATVNCRILSQWIHWVPEEVPWQK